MQGQLLRCLAVQGATPEEGRQDVQAGPLSGRSSQSAPAGAARPMATTAWPGITPNGAAGLGTAPTMVEQVLVLATDYPHHCLRMRLQSHVW